MKAKLTIAAMAVVWICIVAGSALAEPFYVVQDKMGKATVMEGKPGIGWTVIEGPFASKDAAQRALGAGGAVSPTASPSMKYGKTPSVAEFYVVKDSTGRMTVTRGRPSTGWTVVSGPYAEKDAAERIVAGSPRPTAEPATTTAERTRIGGYYVLRDSRGQMAVHHGKAGVGWETVGGPYATKDEAQRALGGALSPTAKP